MKNKMTIKKRSILRVILYILISRLPASRWSVEKLTLQTLEIFAAQRELQMMSRQDIMLLANRMVKIHGADIMRDKDAKNDVITSEKTVPFDNTENMYG